MGIWSDITAKIGIGRPDPADAKARDKAFHQLEGTQNVDVAAWFAVRAGRDLATIPDRVLAMMVPGVRETGVGRLPGLGGNDQGSVERSKHIALAAYEVADHFLKHGDNRGLGTELGKAARHEALWDLARRGVNEFATDNLEGQIARRHETISVNTDKYLEVGGIAERAAQRQAGRLWKEEDKRTMEGVLARYDNSRIKDGFFDKPADMNHAVSVEIAMARAGVLTPRQVVLQANNFAFVSAREEAEKEIGGDPAAQRVARVRPDFDAGGRLEPRTPGYVQAVHRQYSTLEQPIPDALANLRSVAQDREPVQQHRLPTPIAEGRNAAAAVQARGVGMAG